MFRQKALVALLVAQQVSNSNDIRDFLCSMMGLKLRKRIELCVLVGDLSRVVSSNVDFVLYSL